MAPSLNVAANQTANEGALLSLTDIGTITDPGFQNLNNTQDLTNGGETDETFTYEVDWGDGTAHSMGNATVDQIGSPGVLTKASFDGSHTYADNGAYTVKVTVTDDDTGSVSKTFTVTVNNVAPSLTLAANQTVNEGSLLSITDIGSITDPGFQNLNNTQDPTNGGETDETFSYEIDWGDGTAHSAGNAAIDQIGSPGVLTKASFDGAHTYADNGTYTVTITVMDDDTGSVTKTMTVMVNNVAPSLNVAAPQMINEGSLLSITDIGTFTDPGFKNSLNTGDPSNGGETDETFTYEIDWGDGTAHSAGNATVDQIGSPGVLTKGSLDGSHTYADNGVYTVKVTVTDDDMGSISKTFTVTVNNVAPTLQVSDDRTIDEGSQLSITDIGTFTDPGFRNLDNTQDPSNGGETDETFTYEVDWGDSTAHSTGAATVDQIGSVGVLTKGSLDGSHTYADNGTYTVTVTVTDDDVGSVSKTFTVTVNNVDPTLTGINSLSVDEGQAFTLTGLGVGLEDPGFDNPANQGHPTNGGEFEETFTGVDVDWGDGTAVDVLGINNRVSGSVGVFTTAQFTPAAHTFADNGVYTVTLRLSDDDGGVVTRTLTITVNNVAPTLSVPTTQTVNENSQLSLTNIGAFTDPGFNNPANIHDPSNGGETVETFTYNVDWGDGTSANSGGAMVDVLGSPGTHTAGSFDGSHTYADNGSYTVTVTVFDDDLGETTKTFTVVVNNVAPTLNQFPNGKKLEGDDINIAGNTTIRMSLSDPGFDNSANQTNVGNGAEFYETFTHVVEWGDGTVDAVHTYASAPTGPVSISVDGGPAVSFAANGDVNRVLTLAAGQQSLYDNSVPTTLYTFQVNWGDGTVDTVQLALKSPVLPGNVGFPASGSNGQTTVIALQRDSGAIGVNTTAAAELQHTYLGPPDPTHPTADVPIRLTVVDDDGGRDGGAGDPAATILVGNPGINDKMIRIDTSPKVPILTFPIRPENVAVVAQNQTALVSDNEEESGGAAGESKATGERKLVLTVVNNDPQHTLGKSYDLPSEVLSNLPGLIKVLPDGHYRIYLVQAETGVRRLVMDVFVRDGKLIDPGDDSEGGRDRPPTDETKATPPAATGEDGADSGAAPGGATNNDAAIESAIKSLESAPPPNTGGAIELPDFGPADDSPVGPRYPATIAALRHGSMLASVSLALSAAGRSSRTQLDDSKSSTQKQPRRPLKTRGHWRGKKPR